MAAGRHRVLRIGEAGVSWITDDLSSEEPLEIRLDGSPLSVTMRTPGDDFDLAAGFLITEGIIAAATEISSMRMCPRSGAESGPLNVVEVVLRHHPEPPPDPRAFYMTSSCGICGKASIDSVRTQSRHPVDGDPLVVSTSLLASLPGRLREAQRQFARTGGLHAAGLFDELGNLLCAREDVGRHNAFDKVIGWAATAGRLPLRSHMILASGRASFELTQKALMAGIPLLAAVSAPSDLAVALASEAGMTLVGFLRGPTMNVYAGQHRVSASTAPALDPGQRAAG
ncbi:MAG: formate dehydrogenase accessory sulfurtransferase FdhD [Candidatus Dormiibacterota bacterium]